MTICRNYYIIDLDGNFLYNIIFILKKVITLLSHFLVHL
ncbi:hypothetical protein CUBB_gp237c [Staphylococcus phage CUB-B]|nr:hypothetical protein CUBB_gp237c [Staphylococcus phage CUB-B]